MKAAVSGDEKAKRRLLTTGVPTSQLEPMQMQERYNGGSEGQSVAAQHHAFVPINPCDPFRVQNNSRYSRELSHFWQVIG